MKKFNAKIGRVVRPSFDPSSRYTITAIHDGKVDLVCGAFKVTNVHVADLIKEVNKDAEVLFGLSKIEAMIRRMERCTNEYDMKDLLRPMYTEIQNVVSELKSKLK